MSDLIPIALAAIPGIGGSLSVASDKLIAARRRRVEDMARALGLAVSPDQFVDRLESDVDFAELWLDVVETAARTRGRARRRALGRVVGLGAARVIQDLDEVELLVRALAALEPVDVAWLGKIRDWETVHREDNEKAIAFMLEMPSIVAENLTRLGLVDRTTSMNGHPAIAGPSQFGHEVLRYLASGDDDPVSSG